MALSKDELRNLLMVEQAKAPIKTKEVTVPEWGDAKVCIRMLSSGERDNFEQFCGKYVRNEKPIPHFRARLVCLTLCDKEGRLAFTLADLPKIDDLPFGGVELVFDEARAFNKLAVEDVEDAEKNSESATAEGSSSG